MLVTITWDPLKDKWAAHVGYRWTRYWDGSESLPDIVKVALTLRKDTDDRLTSTSILRADTANNDTNEIKDIGTDKLRVFEIDLTPVEATELIGEPIDGNDT